MVNTEDFEVVLETCLNQLEEGATVADCVQQYPELAAKLRPLLEASQRVQQIQISRSEMSFAQEQVWNMLAERGLQGSSRIMPLSRWQLAISVFAMILVTTIGWSLFMC